MTCFSKCLYILVVFLSSVPAFSNKPQIINLYREKYNADNKNWSIGQDEHGVMYFGNNIGLLEFDGVEWNLNKIPNSLIARSVAVQSNRTIFTGGYEEFGRWDRGISGKLEYTSLSDSLDVGALKNDDFWKIWITQDCVYFQSFNSIYIYDYKTVKKLPSNKGFLFLTKVRDEFLAQQIQGALYRMDGDAFQKIEGSDIFQNTDVRVILPYQEDKYLIGTTTKGVYVYDGHVFKEWNATLSSVMNSKELSCGILSSRKTYLFGTILDGIYEVDITGEIIDHISSQNTLQNNTVLSLYEDNLNNVWAALDRGIAYIQYIENMSCYTDFKGGIGAVYDAVLWDDKLFIGTNQGVFYITKEGLSYSDALSYAKLIDGTQGQVWALKVVDDVLYCCHNKGLKEIHKNMLVTGVDSIETGVYNLVEAKVKGRDLLILSTYSSVKIIDKKTKELYSLKQISEPVINAEFDHLGNLWIEHFSRGVYRCKLEDDLSGYRSFSYYGGNNKDGLPYRLRMFKVGGRIVLLGDAQFYTYDDISDKIIPNARLNECFRDIKNIKRVIPIQNNVFWALADASLYKFSYDAYEASILENYDLGASLSLVNIYENVSVLNDSMSLICLDNGFLLYNKSGDTQNYIYKKLPSPYIQSLQTVAMNGGVEYKDLSQDAEISYKFNTVTFSFSSNNTFEANLSFQYMLENVDLTWSVSQKVSSVSYARLPVGVYTFWVRTIDNLGNYSDPVSYKFEISPPWYQTIWAYILYILITIVVLYTIWMLILKRYRNLHLQKIRHRETKRLKQLAGKLQDKVNQKNAELLTQTSFIIQKNELIFKIKDIIDDFYSKNKSSALIPLSQKINALLNNNLDSEDDWKMFLIKFEEKHTKFFRNLKMLYPQLTNSDLRLCACLKLNLETKEIASLMNLSIRAVENSRYRLRKKLNIQPSQNLNEFFLHID